MDWTGEQIHTTRAKLERDVQALVGEILFEYSRLESALDLCLVWVGEGHDLDCRTGIIEGLALFGKLELLAADVNCQAAKRPLKAVYAQWIGRSHTIREHRNTIVHGRLGVDFRREMFVVVVSRATSATVKSVEYSLAELERLIVETKFLTNELSALRDRFPL